MMYNDNPILTEYEYKLLQEQYNNTLFSDRKSSIVKICSILNDCKSSCQFLSKQVNPQIRFEILNAYSELSTILENLQHNSETQSKELSLFTFLTKISNAMEEFLLWQKHEDKEYYKNLVHSNLTSLNKIQTKILSSISKSNIKIFKFM